MNPITNSGRVLNVNNDLAVRTHPREREERFRRTFEHTAVGLGHMTLAGEWTCANRRLCQILGFTRAELLQRSCLEVVCPEGRPTLVEHKRRMLAGEDRS